MPSVVRDGCSSTSKLTLSWNPVNGSHIAVSKSTPTNCSIKVIANLDVYDPNAGTSSGWVNIGTRTMYGSGLVNTDFTPTMYSSTMTYRIRFSGDGGLNYTTAGFSYRR